MSDHRYLVTGAGGCIGAWVVRTLVRDGAHVVGLDLDPEPRRLREISTAEEVARATIVPGDVANAADIGRILDEHAITRVIHLAALQVPFCREDPIRGALVNVVGTVVLLEAVKERLDRIPGLVYASTAAVFGPDDELVATTDETARGAWPSTHYGVYKQANEGNARIYWQDHGVPSMGLRPYTVYGPARDQGITSVPTLATKAAARGERHHVPWGGPCTWNYTEDVARVLIRASEVLREGAAVYNVPGPVAHVRELVELLDAEVPGARELITWDDVPLPLPPALAEGGLERALGPLPIRGLAEAVRETVAHFRAAG